MRRRLLRWRARHRSADKGRGRRRAHARRADGAGGGIFQHAFARQEVVEAAHRGQRPLHAARAQAFLAARR